MADDRFGLKLSAGNPVAIAAYDRAQDVFLKHQDSACNHLAEAIKAEPDFAAAHGLFGLLQVLQAREETMALARQSLAEAAKAAAARSVPYGEQVLVSALEKACQGDWLGASKVLEECLTTLGPHPVLIKIAHNLRFMAGDVAGLLSLTAPFAGMGQDSLPGIGFVLGCHAFALEENGFYDQAEPLAQLALHHEPEDIWAMHALAHVYEVTNRTGEGLLWVESGRQQWSGCNNFSSHMCWHLALFCVDRGNYERALAIYDTDLQVNLTADFRDFANAVSLLERLKQMGVNVGDRLDALYEGAKQRAADATYIFASLHTLIPLVGRKDFKTARQLVDAMKAVGAGKDGGQAEVARRIGVPLAEAFIAVADEALPVDGLVEMSEHLPLLGGSAVQRDVFLRSMIIMADDVCDHKTTSSLIGLRSKMRKNDAFSKLIDDRICFGGNSRDAQIVA